MITAMIPLNDYSKCCQDCGHFPAQAMEIKEQNKVFDKFNDEFTVRTTYEIKHLCEICYQKLWSTVITQQRMDRNEMSRW